MGNDMYMQYIKYEAEKEGDSNNSEHFSSKQCTHSRVAIVQGKGMGCLTLGIHCQGVSTKGEEDSNSVNVAVTGCYHQGGHARGGVGDRVDARGGNAQ